MAIGRAVLHRELGAGSESVEWARAAWARRLWRWRHLALFLLALLAGATATVSLVTNPPEKPPITTSYLPDPHTGSP